MFDGRTLPPDGSGRPSHEMTFEFEQFTRASEKIRSEFPDVSLSDIEVTIVSILYEVFMESKPYIPSWKLLKRAFPESANGRLEALEAIDTLVVKDVVSFVHDGSQKKSRREAPPHLASNIRLREDFILKIDTEKVVELDCYKGFDSNDAFIDSIVHLMTLRTGKHNRRDPFVDSDTNAEVEQYNFALAMHDEKKNRSKSTFPLLELERELELSEIEREIVWFLVSEYSKYESTSMLNITSSLSRRPSDVFKISKAMSVDSKLVTNGVIEIAPNEFHRDDITLNLSPAVLRRVLLDDTTSQASSAKSVKTPSSNIFEVRSPTHSMEQLVLPSETLDIVRTIIESRNPAVADKFKTWGMNADSCRILFTGPSGTGKTATAEAIAATLGKPLLVTDSSRMTSKWVGDSEKNVNNLFHEYYRYCETTNSVPVLFLDECDQIFSNRAELGGTSVARMHQNVQDMLQTNLDSFKGILIGCTNLEERLDEALSRRFDYKISFSLPDGDARLLIWEKHIPDNFPLDNDVNLRSLSSDFELTGGQIAVIVRNVAMEAAVKDCDVSMDMLQRACELEIKGKLGHRSSLKLPVGFRVAGGE
ncbi:MAG: ATP-binding protein [bacterium]|nr:ATP-binding protein [bacterium]